MQSKHHTCGTLRFSYCCWCFDRFLPIKLMSRQLRFWHHVANVLVTWSLFTYKLLRGIQFITGASTIGLLIPIEKSCLDSLVFIGERNVS